MFKIEEWVGRFAALMKEGQSFVLEPLHLENLCS
jgi:hypothetical protein